MGELNIIFISYQESNCESNWEELLQRFPRAKRVHGVEGVHNAHVEAARLSSTPFFFVIDGDNKIKNNFEFIPPETPLDVDSIYVYRCHNPMNDLVYGYGAVKIYNKTLLKRDVSSQYLDLATTITRKYKIIHEVASETYFF